MYSIIFTVVCRIQPDEGADEGVQTTCPEGAVDWLNQMGLTTCPEGDRPEDWQLELVSCHGLTDGGTRSQDSYLYCVSLTNSYL